MRQHLPAVGWCDICHQLQSADTFERQHRDFSDVIHCQQPSFDFTEFDTETTNLHLMVYAPDVLDHAIGAITGQVSGAVQALAGGGKGVGYILFGGHRCPAQVTPGYPGTGQMQLSGNPGGYWLQVGIEQVTLGIVQRPANVGLACYFAASPGGISGVLGWPIKVVDVLNRGLLVEAIDQRLLQWLARKVDDAHALGDLPGALQGIDRRRHGIDQAHLVAGRQVGQFQGIAREDQRAAVGQGDEDFPYRKVEAHRGRGQYPLDIFVAVDLLRPVDQRQNVAMGNGHALGLASGTGGVDHVGQVIGRGPSNRYCQRVSRQLIHQQHLRLGLGQVCEQIGLGQQHLGATVFEHVGHAVGGVIRVQRHIGAAGLEHPEQGDDQRVGTLHGHADPHFGTNAQFDQLVGQLIGLAVQLAIAQGLGAVGQGQGVRLTLNLLGDQLVNTAFHRVFRYRRVPITDLLLIISAVQ